MKSSKTFGSSIKHSPLHLCETIAEAELYIGKGYRADESFESITSPIHSAGSLELLKYYLECGTDPNAGAELKRSTPLHTHSNSSHLLLLLKYGANPNTQNGWGQTPLFKSETAAKVKILLENGADPNIRDAEGLLPDEWWTDEDEGIQMKKLVKTFRQKKDGL